MTTTRTALPDWDAPVRNKRVPGQAMQMAGAILIFVVAAAALTYSFGLVIGFGGVMAINIAIVFAAFLWAANQGLFALRSLKARRIRPDDEPRLWNIASGLAKDLTVAPPALFVIPDDIPNAMVCRAKGPALAVTRGLLDGFTRTELEAVIAHCMARLLSADVERASLALALGPLGTRSIPQVGFEDDVRAAAITRYPPALADAVEKAKPMRGRYSAFWFVADDPSHRPAPERAAAIRDL
jgi:Zn-dependent protease with chaperone function